MRTTLNIDDDLLKEAKIAAVRGNSTLTWVIESGLRRELEALKRDRRGKGGLPAHIDPDDSQAVWDFIKAASEDFWTLRAIGSFPTREGKPIEGVDWDDSSAVLEAMEDPIAHS